MVTAKRFPRISRQLVHLVFFGLIAVFFALYVRSLDWGTIANLTIDWGKFGIGAVLGLGFLYLGAYIWRVILRALGASGLPDYRTTTDVYAKAWMGRYIPGTITWVAAKVYLASKWGISKSRLSVASLLEGGVQVLAFVFVGFVLLGSDPRADVIPANARLLLIVLGLMVLVVLIPSVFNRILSLLFRLRRTAASDELRSNTSSVLRSFGLYTGGGLLYGAAGFFIVWSIAPGLAVGDIWFVIGAFCLSTVAGMAAPFAPSGIGIKDGLLLILLSAVLTNETALAATILSRVVTVLIDVVFLVISQVSNRNGTLTAHA